MRLTTGRLPSVGDFARRAQPRAVQIMVGDDSEASMPARTGNFAMSAVEPVDQHRPETLRHHVEGCLQPLGDMQAFEHVGVFRQPDDPAGEPSVFALPTLCPS